MLTFKIAYAGVLHCLCHLLQVLQRPIEFKFPWKGLGIFTVGSVAGVVLSTWFFLIPFTGFAADIEKSMILFENVMLDIKRVSFRLSRALTMQLSAALMMLPHLRKCALLCVVQ
jgi:hypothetical protein